MSWFGLNVWLSVPFVSVSCFILGEPAATKTSVIDFSKSYWSRITFTQLNGYAQNLPQNPEDEEFIRTATTKKQQIVSASFKTVGMQIRCEVHESVGNPARGPITL